MDVWVGMEVMGSVIELVGIATPATGGLAMGARILSFYRPTTHYEEAVRPTWPYRGVAGLF